jgi:hypothetical protein
MNKIDNKQIQEVREEIIELIRAKLTGKTKNGEVWCYPNIGICESLADSILSLKGDGWEIGIIDTKAELPENHYYHGNTLDFAIYSKAQQDMVNQGWVKRV